jgi:hypothetical protein
MAYAIVLSTHVKDSGTSQVQVTAVFFLSRSILILHKREEKGLLIKPLI